MKTKTTQKKSYKSKKRNYKKSRHPTTKLWSHNLIVPDRYFVPLELEMTAKIPVAAPANGFFWIQGNSLYDPFGLYAPLGSNYSMASGVAVLGGTTNFTITTGGSVNNDYKGVSQLQLLYNRYKINWSSLSIQTNVVNGPNSLQWTIVPFAASQSGNYSSVKPLSFLSSTPYSVEKFCTNTSPIKDQILTCKMSSKKILGLNKYQYGSKEANTTTGAAAANQPPVDNAFLYFCQYNVMTDSAIANSEITLVFKLKALCEFSERIQQSAN